MLGATDYGHLNKFLVSLGLILAGAAVVVPWAVLREDGPLRVTTEEIEQLTPTAKRVIERRQQDYDLISGIYLWFAAALLTAGLALVLWGLVRWRKRQNVVDDIEDSARDEARFRVLQLTPQEQTDRQHERIQEEAEVINPLDPSEIPAGEPIEAQPAQSSAAVGPSLLGTKWREDDNQLTSVLSTAFSSTHRVQRGLKLQDSHGPEYIADVALVPADVRAQAQPLVAVQIKHAGSPGMVLHKLREPLLQFAAFVALSRTTSKTLIGCFIMVLSDDLVAEQERRASVRKAIHRALDRAYGQFAPVSVVVLLESADMADVDHELLRDSVLAVAQVSFVFLESGSWTREYEHPTARDTKVMRQTSTPAPS